MANVKVPKLPTIRRLPTYLYKLSEMRKAGIEIVATPELARYMNLGEIVIRKDLALTGVTGQPGVGYKVRELIDAIKRYLNWNNVSEAVLVGAGALGSALMGYEGFEEDGLRIIAAFDADPLKVGTEVRGRSVFDIDRLEELARELLKRFPGTAVVLTLGGSGSVYLDGQEMVHQAAYRVKAVDTTAAGDTFTGFFVGGMLRGFSAREAMDIASRAAAIAVSRPGAAPSIPLWEEAVNFK